MKLALEMHRAARGPQRFEDRDLFLHQRVAFFLGIAHAFGLDPRSRFVPAIRLMQMRPPDSWSKVDIIFAIKTGLM